MRVLLANKFFRPGAGAETAFFATRELLTNAGHEVIDFGMASDDNVATPYADYFAPERSYGGGGPRHRQVGDALASIYSPAARGAIRRLVRDARPDVAHLHNIYHQLTLSIVDELSAQRVPTVLTLHDYKIVCPSYTLYTEGAPCRRCVTSHPFHAVAHRCIKGSRSASALGSVETAVARTRGSYRQIDALIAPSRFLADLARTKVEHDRVHVLPNFLPVHDPPASLPADQRDRVIFFAGRLELVKGIEPLLRAFDSHDTGGCRLVIAGDGPLRPAVEQAARESAGIEYIGRVSHAEVGGRLRASAAVIVPSLWEENYPMIVLEARVAGAPVICAGTGGLPEMVDDEVDGLLCDSTSSADIARAVRRLALDPSAAEQMAVRGRQRVERENAPAAHLRGLERIYAQALSTASARSRS